MCMALLQKSFNLAVCLFFSVTLKMISWLKIVFFLHFDLGLDFLLCCRFLFRYLQIFALSCACYFPIKWLPSQSLLAELQQLGTWWCRTVNLMNLQFVRPQMSQELARWCTRCLYSLTPRCRMMEVCSFWKRIVVASTPNSPVQTILRLKSLRGKVEGPVDSAGTDGRHALSKLQ